MPLVALVKKVGLRPSLVLIYPSSLKPNTGNNSFESLVLSLSHPTWKTGQPAVFTVLSRPPGPHSELLSEFTEFLSSLDLKSDEVINIDFNIDVANDSLAVAFNSVSSQLCSNKNNIKTNINVGSLSLILRKV